MTSFQDDTPPPLPPRIPLSAQTPAVVAEKSEISPTGFVWSIRSVGFASLGLGVGGLGGAIVTWIIMAVVHAYWGVGAWAEWIVVCFALLPVALVGILGTIEKPAAAAGVAGILLFKALFGLYLHGTGVFPARPFDVVETAGIAAIVWGLSLGILGALGGAAATGAALPASPTK